LGDCIAGELVLAEPVDDEWDAIGSQIWLRLWRDDQGRPLTQCARRLTPFSSPR
jgi:hypothetical protein